MTVTLEGTSRVSDYLRLKNNFAIDNNCAAPKDWAHRTYEGMVLDLGRPYERKPLPRSFRRMRLGHCFHNALYCVMRDSGEDRYMYVEGYAAGSMVTEHAWVLDTDDGKIFDPTWPRDENHALYYGIVLPTEFVWRRTIETGVYGILACDYLSGNYLLRTGRDAWKEFEV